MRTLAELLTPRSDADINALLVQSLNGVGPVLQSGAGLGKVRASGHGKIAATVTVKIVASGNIGGAEYQVSSDGITWSAAATVPAIPFLHESGAVLEFIDAAGESESFVAETRYVFQTNDAPVQYTAWQATSGPGKFLWAQSQAGADVDARIAQIAAGGYPAAARDAGLDLWLDLALEQMYDTARIPAGSTVGFLKLADNGAGPWEFAAGDLIAGPLGSSKRFVSTSAVTVPLNGSAFVQIEAESPGSDYNLLNGTIDTLITAFPGLSCTNPARIEPITASSVGAALPVVTGSPVAEALLLVEMQSATTYRWSQNNGETWLESDIAISAEPRAMGATGCSIAFAADLTFVDGITYSCAVGRSWISVQGHEKEDNFAYFDRATARWADLSIGQPSDAWLRQVRLGSTQVTRVTTAPSLSVTGRVDVICAGAAGELSAQTIAQVQSVLRATMPATAKAFSASNLEIALSGTIFIASAYWAVAQGNITSALAKFCAECPIGGLVLNGSRIVSIDDIKAIIKTTRGVLDINLMPNDDPAIAWNQIPAISIAGVTFVRVE